MTRKDFELIASAIQRADKATAHGYKIGVTTAAYAIADALQTENPRFDRGRFLEACGVEE